MKIFRKGQKNRRGALALALTGLTLALLLTLTTHAALYTGFPTDNSSYLSELKAKLHPGAGEQYVNGRITLDPGIGALPNITTYFDARGVDGNGNKRPSFFQASKNAAHSVLASLYDFMVVDGPLFIGLPLGAFQSSVGSGIDFGLNTNPSQNGNNPIIKLWTHNYGSGINPFSATLQKVNVAGAVRSSALSHQYTDPQRVCVDAEGRFTLDCPSGPTQTYSCTGNTPTNASLCAGDDQGLSQDTQITLVSSCTNTQKCEYTCNTGYHIENGFCVQDASYEWQTGDWGACTGGSVARCEGTWTTQGSGACTSPAGQTIEHCEGTDNSSNANGLDYDCEYCSDQGTEQDCAEFDSRCEWNDGVETHSCSASNPQSQSACESQNSACTWVEAQDAVKTRSVYCVESGTNNVVPDSNCDSTQRPDDTQSCAYWSVEEISGASPYTTTESYCTKKTATSNSQCDYDDEPSCISDTDCVYIDKGTVVKDRSVVCMKDGSIVADSQCPSPKPNDKWIYSECGENQYECIEGGSTNNQQGSSSHGFGNSYSWECESSGTTLNASCERSYL